MLRACISVISATYTVSESVVLCESSRGKQTERNPCMVTGRLSEEVSKGAELDPRNEAPAPRQVELLQNASSRARPAVRSVSNKMDLGAETGSLQGCTRRAGADASPTS